MHAASRHGAPSLASLPKDGGLSCFGRSSGRSPKMQLAEYYSCQQYPKRAFHLPTGAIDPIALP